MISWSSTLASSQPATSAKVTLGVSPESSLAFDFPKENARLPPACSWRRRKNHSPRMTTQGSAATMIVVSPPFGSRAEMGTPDSSSRLRMASLLAIGRRTVKLLAGRSSCMTGERKSPWSCLPSITSTLATFPRESSRLKSV